MAAASAGGGAPASRRRHSQRLELLALYVCVAAALSLRPLMQAYTEFSALMLRAPRRGLSPSGALTKRVRVAQSVSELLKLVSLEEAPVFDHLHARVVYMKLIELALPVSGGDESAGKDDTLSRRDADSPPRQQLGCLDREEMQMQLRALTARTAALLPVCKPKELTEILRTYSVLNIHPGDDFVKVAIVEMRRQLSTFNNQELTSYMRSLANLQADLDEPCLAELLRETTRRAPRLKKYELISVLSSHAQLLSIGQWRSEALLAELRRAFAALGSQVAFQTKFLNPSQVALCLSAFAQLGIDPGARLYSASLRAWGSRLASLKTRDLGSSLRRFAKLGYPVDAEFKADVERAVERRLQDLRGGTLVQILWSCKTMGIQLNARVLEVAEKALLAERHKLTPHNLAFALSTYATHESHRPSEDFSDKMLQQVSAVAPKLSAWQLTDALRACAGLGHVPQTATLAILLERLRVLLPSFTWKELSMLLRALPRLQARLDDELLAQLLKQLAQSRRVRFTASGASLEDGSVAAAPAKLASELPGALLAAARLGGGGQQTEQALSDLAAQLGDDLQRLEFEGADLSTALKALSRLNLAVHHNVALALLGEVVQRAPTLAPKDLASCFRAYADLVSGVWAPVREAVGQDFVKTVSMHLCTMAPGLELRDVANVFHAFGLLREAPSVKLHAALLDQAHRVLSTCEGVSGGVNLATLLWASAKWAPRPGENFLVVAARQALRLLPALGAKEISHILWAYASLGYDPGEQVVRGLEEASRGLISRFRHDDIARSLWAYGKFGYLPGASALQPADDAASVGAAAAVLPRRGPPDGLLSLFEEPLLEQRKELVPRGLSTTLWAFATLGVLPSKGLLAALCAEVRRKLHLFGAQSLSITLWALARLDWNPGQDFMEAALEQVQAHLPSYNGQALSNVLWACARQEHNPGPRMLDVLLAKMSGKLDIVSNQALGATLWACARLVKSFCYAPDPEIVGALLRKVRKRRKQLSAVQVANVLWACSLLEYDDADLPVRELAADAEIFWPELCGRGRSMWNVAVERLGIQTEWISPDDVPEGDTFGAPSSEDNDAGVSDEE